MRLFLIAVLCACASSPPRWQAPRHVVTVYAADDGAVRRSVEDALAAKLQRLGIAATPSYAVNGTSKLDGVVVLRGDIGNDRWTPNWSMHSNANVDLSVPVEVTVYSLDGRVLWSAVSKTTPGDTIDEVTTVAAQDLVASLR